MSGAVATLDHIIVAVPDLDAAAAGFERLGLQLTPVSSRADRATRNRAFFVGSPESEFYVELLAIDDPAAAAHTPRAAPLIRTLERGGGPYALALAAPDLDAARAALARLPDGAEESQPLKDDGTPVCDLLQPRDQRSLGCAVSVLHYPEALADRRARHSAQGVYTHAFPLMRLDHLALLPVDFDATTSAWTETFGVDLHGELRNETIVVRQVKLGDAILELLGPASPDSPIAQRPPGLLPMAAFQVPDLAVAVELARERGFTVSDPAPGFLPGTRTATIAGDAFAGLGLQLLEYV